MDCSVYNIFKERGDFNCSWSSIVKRRELIGYLKVKTALVIGQPTTKEVVESRVTSDTSGIQVDIQTSHRGTCKIQKLRIWKATVRPKVLILNTETF